MRTRKVSERLVNGGVVIEKETKIYLGNYEVKCLHKETKNGETTILKRQTLRVMDDETCVAIIHYWEQDDLQREVEQAGTRKLRYQLDNHLGSVSLEVEEDAQIISYEEYFPYGGTAFIAGRNQKEVKLKEYRYSGKERDDATGLYYYGARYYVPWLGRWLKPDPAGTEDGMNMYQFVGGNPVLQVDIGGTGKGKEKKSQIRSKRRRKKMLKKEAERIARQRKNKVGKWTSRTHKQIGTAHQALIFGGKIPKVVKPHQMTPERSLVRHISTVLLALQPKREEVQAAISRSNKKIYIASNYSKEINLEKGKLGQLIGAWKKQLSKKELSKRESRHLEKLEKEVEEYGEYELVPVTEGWEGQHAETKIVDFIGKDEFDYIGGTKRPCQACSVYFRMMGVAKEKYNPHPGALWGTIRGLLPLSRYKEEKVKAEFGRASIKWYKNVGAGRRDALKYDSDSD